jgi:glycosyltransferase involved in cell wall biosynthesis
LNNLRISIIVPCFNEEAIITETYKRIKNVLFNSSYQDFEILFVNDGSLDSTFLILNKISEEDSNVKLISLSRNFGHQAAVSAGIQYCTGDVAIIIDADLQDPPELFPEMIEKYQVEKCNVVYGVRQERKGETFFKKITAKLYYKLINSLSDTKLPLDTGDFRLIDKKVITEFRNLKEKNKYIRGIISWIGFKQIPIYYSRDSRMHGETKYPLSKMLKFALTGLLYFTKKPLKLAISLGFVSILVGLTLVVYIVIAKFSNNIYTVQGWTSTMIVIIFFGGVQLLTVGVLGEYIGSIFDEVKNRPEYIIDEKINFKEKN